MVKAVYRIIEQEGVDIFNTDSHFDNASPMNMHSMFWQRKADRPSYNELKRDIERMGYVNTGKKYGVSDNAVRKWLNFYKNRPKN